MNPTFNHFLLLLFLLLLSRKYYGAEHENLNFEDDPEGSREIINKWVESQTNEKIKELLPKGSIDEDTALVLVNAIYFKVCTSH